jgi:ABC-type multidrug transport system ATPase subunit
LNIVSVPVRRTRYFWHNTQVRNGNRDIPLLISVGVDYKGQICPVTLRFRNQGDELVYCAPDESALNDMALLEHAASIRVELLYPMSGLETEEPILQSGRIDVLLGQGQTAQVLRNLCLIVARQSPEDWLQVQTLMHRLFAVELGEPQETARGAIELIYRQAGVKEPLDVAMAGRGFQQMLLIFAYLYSHKRSVLLVDEPDAHLEILRQKQVYVLLRDIAHRNESQVVLVTHSEVILDEALERNLTLLVEGQAEDLAKKQDIRNTLKLFGADHYVKARERGYVLYVEGGTDVDMLRGLAERMQHPVMKIWDERINSFYVQNNHSQQDLVAELERVEGGFGTTPREHFFALRALLPELLGFAILDSDGRNRPSSQEGGLQVCYWRRYEAENYFITPEVLRRYASQQLEEYDLFQGFGAEIEASLSELILERVFAGVVEDYAAYRDVPATAARLIWEARTERIKLSDFAESFFRLLSQRTGGPMLLTKGEFHLLIPLVEPASIPAEVTAVLDSLERLFRIAAKRDAAEYSGQ